MIDNPFCGLIIANGLKLSDHKVQRLATDKMVLVLDGAYSWVRQLGIKVDYLLGDFDSVDTELLNEAALQNVKVIPTPDQSKTDLEKGIQWLDTKNMKEIYICCATGLRMDHTLHNIRLLSRCYRDDRYLEINTETEKLFMIKDKRVVYNAKAGDQFAILGAPECTVTTKGLLFDMQHQRLSYSGFNSISNMLEKDYIELDIQGVALIIHEHQENH